MFNEDKPIRLSYPHSIDISSSQVHTYKSRSLWEVGCSKAVKSLLSTQLPLCSWVARHSLIRCLPSNIRSGVNRLRRKSGALVVEPFYAVSIAIRAITSIPVTETGAVDWTTKSDFRSVSEQRPLVYPTVLFFITFYLK